MDRQLPTPQIVDRFVHVVLRAMKAPAHVRFNQLGKDERRGDAQAALTEALCQGMVARMTRGTPASAFEKFEELLRAALTTEQPFKDWPEFADDPKAADSWKRDRSWERQRSYYEASADYGPDPLTAALMARAGLNEHHFPIKSNFSIGGLYGEPEGQYVTEAVGYGAPRSYHYPLGEDRWLVTSLTGNLADMRRLCALALEHPEAFTIEATAGLSGTTKEV